MALLSPTTDLLPLVRTRGRVRVPAHGAGLGAALIVAVLLRLLWIARAHTYPAPLMDQGFYDDVARRLAGGLGYTTSEGVPTATFPPGYPFLLAAAYRLFGPSVAAAQTLNVACAAGVVLLTYALGRHFAGRRAGLVAAWLIALLPGQVLWPALVMSELPFTLALLASLWLFARGLAGRSWSALPVRPRVPVERRGPRVRPNRWPGTVRLPSPVLFASRMGGAPKRHKRPGRIPPAPLPLRYRPVVGGVRGPATLPLLIAGLLGGYAALTRGQAIGLPLVLLVWALWQRRPGAARAAALYSAAFVLVLIPWTVRNAVQIDRSVLLSSNAGWNAVIGHDDQADGGFWSPLYGHRFDAYLALPPVEREVAMHQQGMRMALTWALRHPGREGNLALRKTARLWSPAADAVRWQESPGVQPFLGRGERTWLARADTGAYLALMLLALPALLMGVRRQEPLAVLLLLLAGYWTAFHILFFAESRYVFPLLPLFCLPAAVTLCRGWAFLRSPRPAPAGTGEGRHLVTR